MILILTVAAAAALTVLVYVRLRHRDPSAADAAAHAVRQLAAVVLVCTKAIEGLEEALTSRPRPRVVYAGSGPWGRPRPGWPVYEPDTDDPEEEE